MVEFKISAPVLASLNIEETVRFYSDRLGFDHIDFQDENYAVIRRHNLILHFWKCDNRIHPENTSCYIYVSDIDDLYRELTSAKVIHPNGKLEDKPWGMKEFAILDNFGNMIKFGEHAG